MRNKKIINIFFTRPPHFNIFINFLEIELKLKRKKNGCVWVNQVEARRSIAALEIKRENTQKEGGLTPQKAAIFVSSLATELYPTQKKNGESL